MIDVTDKLPELISQMESVISNCSFILDDRERTLSDIQRQLVETMHRSALRHKQVSQHIQEAIETGTINPQEAITCALHDLQNPLTLLHGFCLLLEMEAGHTENRLNHKQQEYVQVIQSLAEEYQLYLGYLRDERTKLLCTNQDNPA